MPHGNDHSPTVIFRLIFCYTSLCFSPFSFSSFYFPKEYLRNSRWSATRVHTNRHCLDTILIKSLQRTNSQSRDITLAEDRRRPRVLLVESLSYQESSLKDGLIHELNLHVHGPGMPSYVTLFDGSFKRLYFLLCWALYLYPIERHVRRAVQV